MEMIIGLLCGAGGGLLGGRVFPGLSLGTAGNAISGIVGGAVLPSVLSMVGLGGMTEAVTGSGMDPMALVSQVAGGAVGGTGAMAIFGTVKNMLGK